MLLLGLVGLLLWPPFYQQPTQPMKTMEVQYAYTILYVTDVPATLEFYEKALGFERRFLTPEQDYGEVKSGPTVLAFANLALGNANFKNGFLKSETDQKPFGIELAFTTSDVASVMEKALSHGSVVLSEKVTKPWGQEVGYLRDINGFILEICTPIPGQE